MNRGSSMTGLLTAGIVGVTIGAYAVSHISPRERKKAMKRTRRMLTKATGMLISNIL